MPTNSTTGKNKKPSPNGTARTGDQDTISRILRVDHAGEVGARRIYDGQLAVLGNHPVAEEIRHMRDQEQEHLDTFQALINQHEVRPTLLSPFWNGAGFVLGVVTASMGTKAAMACTMAVEEVIGTHYDRQAATLPPDDKLTKTLLRFRDEELEHHDTAQDHGGDEAVGYPLMRRVIQAGCRVAIKIAERV